MKNELKLEELRDKNSPYFCGSACLLTLNSLVKASVDEIVDTKEIQKKLELSILKLAKEDAKLFDYSKKDELSIEEWEDASDIISDYTDLFSSLYTFESLFSKSSLLLKMILDCHKFLLETIIPSTSMMSEREDVSNRFKREVYSLVIAGGMNL